MGFKYKISNDGIYFITATVVDWIDVFTRKELAEIAIDSLRYCQQEKGLVLYAWCLMPSHLHFIASAEENVKLSDIMRDFKKFTSKVLLPLSKKLTKAGKNGCWINLNLPEGQVLKTRNISSGRTASIQ